MRKYDYLILLLLAQPVWGLNSHPRIWLDSATRSTLAAKFASGDPDWAQVKAYADIALSKPFQVMTIVSATNSNPVQFTIQGNMPIPTGVVFYLGGGTGAWAAVNKPGRSAGYWTATVTGARTFTLPIDSTSFGPLTGNLVGFPASGCLTGFTCYDYEGAGWQESIEPLAIAYKVTGNTAYAYKALAWMDYVNSLGAAGIDGPESTDSGYPSRSAVLTLGLVYDWCYDQLNYDGNGAARKAATAVTASLWFNWMQSNAWFGPAPTSNYWAGHILGFGVLGYATQGDNPNAQTLIDWATTQWNTYAVPGLTPAAPGTSTGRLYSGVMPGTHYDAPYTWPWTAMYMLTRATAGDTALPNYSAVANKMARALIYDLKPDRWAIRRDGVQTGSVTGVFSGIGPLALAHFLTQYAANADDSLKGGWMQWQFQHFGTAPNGTGNLLLNNKIAPHNYVERLLFYWPNRQAIDYAQTEPTYFYAPSDQPRIFWRSDWSTAADWLMFNASQHFISSGTGDTQIAGELDINRGTDYLIVNGQNWFGSGDGTSGLSSAGGIYTGNDLASTLYFNDGGLCARGIPGGQWGGGAYAGDPLNNLTPTYGYARADLTTPYNYNCSGTTRSLRYWYREVTILGNGTYVVFDRSKSSQATFGQQIRWQLSSLGTPVASGNVVTNVVGSSKIYINTVLPAGPTINIVRNPGPTNWRAEVGNGSPNTDLNVLTVLYATGAAGNSPAMTNLTTIDTNHVGVQIADQTPKVVVLAAPVTDNGNGSYTPNTYSKVTFSTTHAGSGKYVVAGLIPGAYSVSNNGTTVIASQVVGTDGTLSFTSNSGAFSIQQGQATSSPCDLNSDGVTNVLDVQIAVNILLGNGTCPASFVTSGGCTLTVPKIVTPALGGACIAP